MAVEREEVRSQGASEDWALREGSREGLVPEVSLAGGAEPAEAVGTGSVSPGWGPTAGKPLLQ